MTKGRRRETGEGDATFQLSTLTESAPTGLVVSLLWEGGSETIALPDLESFVIGRADDVEIPVRARSISRRHARLYTVGGWAIEDLGSVNGTRVRGNVIPRGERVPIALDEPVMVGDAILVLRQAPPSAAATTEGLASREPSLVGALQKSPMADVERLVALSAPSEVSVLLLGETGSGKGYFARQIHDRSRRAAGPFVHLNCAALPENLLESELFGYERGAFSGAAQAKPGLLESAERGTVFLDEIGDLPLALQAKLLVAIERREVQRLGALRPRPIDVRIVSATNKPSDANGIAGLRPDLYFRLAGLPIRLPALRDRTDEIPALAAAFCRDAAKRSGREPPKLSEDAVRALVRHPWPGNVRELAAVIERALLFSGDTLREADLHLEPPPSSAPAAAPQVPPATPSSMGGPPVTERQPLRSLPAEYEELERRRIAQALESCAGNQSRAAEILGISRRTLVSRIAEFGLPRPRKR